MSSCRDASHIFARMGHLVVSIRGSHGRSDVSFDRRLIAPMILGALLNPVNSSIIAVSLVPIGVSFGAPTSQTVWLVSALYLATAIGQPVAGRLIDAYGPRKLFLAGSVLTGMAGLLGTVAPSLLILIGARIVLGFGTCAGYPAAMYLIRSEANRTGIESPSGVLTALAVSGQTIAVIGPTLGGVLIGLGGWRATFAINIFLSIVGLILGARRLPRMTQLWCDEVVTKEGGMDVSGILLFAGMLTALLLFLMNPTVDNWYLIVITVAAATGLVVRELHVAEPFLDLRLFGGNLPLLATYCRNLLAMTVTYTFLYGYSQWMEDGRGLSAYGTGLVLIPLSLAAVIVSSTTGRRREVRGKLIVGAISQVFACALLLFLGSDSAMWMLVAVAVVIGIPQGLNSLANQNAVYYQADPSRMGSSAGLLRTFTYLGAIIASAANGAFFGHRASTYGLHHLALFILVVAVMFFFVTVFDRSLGRIGRRANSSKEQPPGDPRTVVV